MTTTQIVDHLLGKHSFCFNGHTNGGESFSLETKIWNKSGMLYQEQEFTLNSYCNSTHFKLNGEIITPDQLRQLANELDKKRSALINKKVKKRSALINKKVTSGQTDELLATHTFVFTLSPGDDNSLSLVTEYFDNGDGVPEGIYENQKLILQAYGNSAFFNLCGTNISADHLRKLANELDALMATINTDGLEE